MQSIDHVTFPVKSFYRRPAFYYCTTHHHKAFIFIFMALMLPFSLYAQRKNLILQENFENSEGLKGWEKETCCHHSALLTDSVARDGKKSLRFELRNGDRDIAGSKRSEIKLHSETGNDRWYGFSIYPNHNFINDSIPEILVQWHEIPDWDLGEHWRTPPISLVTEQGEWSLIIKWSAAPVNTNKTIQGKKILKLGKTEINQWTDFVLHIVFSYQQDGCITVWKNGKTVAEYAGPNSYNDQKLPYFKLGVYKWGWKNYRSKGSSSRVVFFDEVYVGNEKATYIDVAPGKR